MFDAFLRPLAPVPYPTASVALTVGAIRFATSEAGATEQLTPGRSAVGGGATKVLPSVGLSPRFEVREPVLHRIEEGPSSEQRS
jgi:hypothetical protein